MIDFGADLHEIPITGSNLKIYSGRLPDPKCRSKKVRCGNWAFLIHPLMRDDFIQLDPRMKLWIEKKGNLFLGMVNGIPVQAFGKGYIQYSRYRRVIKTSYGVFILIPYLPEQFEQESMREKIIAAIREAANLAKAMNCHYLGLGAYTSIITGNGKLLADLEIIPVTSGGDTTGIGAVSGVLKGCRAMKIRPANSTVAIIGGTGAVGRPASVLLSDHFQKVIIVARNQARMDSLFELIKAHTKSDKEIVTCSDINQAIRQAQAVVFATNKADAKELQIDSDSFLPGAVVCDLAIPKAVTKEIHDKRKHEVLFFDGAIFCYPGENDCEQFLRMGSASESFGCLLETMLLALEGKDESYSVGPIMNFAQIKELKRLIRKYRPRISDLRYCGEKIPRETIVSIRKYCQSRRVASLRTLPMPQAA